MDFASATGNGNVVSVSPGGGQENIGKLVGKLDIVTNIVTRIFGGYCISTVRMD